MLYDELDDGGTACPYPGFQCFPGIGENGTPACDCSRYFSCGGEACVERRSETVWVLILLPFLLTSLVAFALSARAIHKHHEAGKLAIKPTLLTVAWVMVASLAGVAWGVRRLIMHCDSSISMMFRALNDVLVATVGGCTVMGCLNVGLIW